jgi:hypothetical protein
MISVKIRGRTKEMAEDWRATTEFERQETNKEKKEKV